MCKLPVTSLSARTKCSSYFCSEFLDSMWYIYKRKNTNDVLVCAKFCKLCLNGLIEIVVGEKAMCKQHKHSCRHNHAVMHSVSL